MKLLLSTVLLFISALSFGQGYIEFNVQHTSCESCFDASIDVTLSGCWGGLLTFDWQGPTAFASQMEDLAAIPVGNYTLTVVDDIGQEHSSTINIDDSGGSSTYSENIFLECSGLGLPVCWIGYFPADSIGGPNEARVFFPPCWTLPVDIAWRNSNDEIISTLCCIENVPSDEYSLTLTSQENEILTLYLPMTIGTEDGTTSVDVCTQTSIEESAQQAFRIFPNPMAEQAIIEYNLSGNSIQLELYSLQGLLVQSERLSIKNSQIIFRTEGLQSGQYLVRLLSENSSVVSPIMIE